jgi:opacity protein-like surface antigen
MLRNRMLMVLGGCLLAASAAWADGVAYVDCSSHPESTPVFGKPRRTPETVASLPCGERFTILLNGFIFSRIQTKDGTVGYVYSNLVSADRSGTVVQQPASAPLAAAAPKPATAVATEVQPNATAPAQPQAKPVAQVLPEPTPASNVSSTAAPAVQPSSTTLTQTQPAPVQPAPAQPATTPSRVPETAATIVPETPAAIVPPSVPSPSAAPEQSASAPAQLAATEGAAPAASVTEAPATVTPSDPAATAQPEPTPAEPVRSVVQPANATESWEKPNPGVRTVGLPRMPLIELFGGYGFARFDNGGGVAASNLNGVIGSFGWNIKPWLQLVADSSYDVVTVSGTKNVLYGNHWGPRIFRRVRNRWGITPFVEGLAGGSRADTTVSGAGGYKTSQNCISYKVGGGVDIKPSRHFEIRLFDVDYYRTSFGTNLHQNNYWASAGIVIRLFGGRE